MLFVVFRNTSSAIYCLKEVGQFSAVHLAHVAVVLVFALTRISNVGQTICEFHEWGIGSLAYLFMYWKTRNLWAVAISHGLYDYLIEFPSALFVETGAAASNTQDYVSMTGDLATANLAMQLIVMAVDIVICIWIWKKHMKDVDFEEIRNTWY